MILKTFQDGRDLESDRTKWPWTSLYFDPLTQDAFKSQWLLRSSPKICSSGDPRPKVIYTYLKDRTVHTSEAISNHSSEGGLLSHEVSASSLVVVYFPARRSRNALRYPGPARFPIDASVGFEDQELWTTVIQHFDVHTGFLELIHRFDGGVTHDTSYEVTKTLASDAVDTMGAAHTAQKPFAFHLSCDPGGTLEIGCNAIYARRDLVTGQSFVLVLGRDVRLSRWAAQVSWAHEFENQIPRIHRLLHARSDAQTLHVIHALIIASDEQIQQTRALVDEQTFLIESQSGVGYVRKAGARIKPENLSFNISLYRDANFAKEGMHSASRAVENCRAFLVHVAEYQALCKDFGIPPGINTADLQCLKNAACSTLNHMEVQEAGLKHLLSRILAQIDLQKSMMAARDTKTNIEISQAAVHDSKLVRGIAYVTMVFLPGTFVATLFSMVFFDGDDSGPLKLAVRPSLWLYPVITLPLTAIVILIYSAWSIPMAAEGLPTKREDDNDECVRQRWYEIRLVGTGSSRPAHPLSGKELSHM